MARCRTSSSGMSACSSIHQMFLHMIISQQEALVYIVQYVSTEPLLYQKNSAAKAMHKATSIADQDEPTGRLLQVQEDFASLVDKVESVKGLSKTWVVQDSTSCQRECMR